MQPTSYPHVNWGPFPLQRPLEREFASSRCLFVPPQWQITWPTAGMALCIPRSLTLRAPWLPNHALNLPGKAALIVGDGEAA